MERLGFSLEVKDVGETGEFSGFASTYGNKDHHGEIVDRGAFADSIGKEVPVLWAHDMANPVGLGKLSDSERGLVIDGSLDLDVQSGKDAHSRLKKRIVKGLSIGFFTPKDGSYRDDEGIRHLRRVDLAEVSLVAFPANPQAVVTAVKSIGSVRDLERFLHQAGYSRREATAIASHGFKGLAGLESEDEDSQLLEYLRAANKSAA